MRNYREGHNPHAEEISAEAARERVWLRNQACHACRLSCKKCGVVKEGPFAHVVHDGPEYETGTMVGPNLLVHSLEGMLAIIQRCDDLGIDVISTGNVLGFLMEARELGHISLSDMDGIDLQWGAVEPALQMVERIAAREGFGALASQGVWAVSEALGPETARYAIHVKGMELAAHNVHLSPARALCYATAHRGACHLFGDNAAQQDLVAAVDSTGLCLFASKYTEGLLPGMDARLQAELLGAVTGEPWTAEDLRQVGERVITLEKCFNTREGFGREDDVLPDRFFEDELTWGRHAGAKLDRGAFEELLSEHYQARGWDPETSHPLEEMIHP